MQYRALGNTGLEVSILSLGASPFGGVFGAVSQTECKACLDAALEAGVNFIDCSPYYGLTKAETMLGRTLRRVAREKFILAIKVGRYGADFDGFDFSAARVSQSVDESLNRLGVDFVDIIQCHDIEFGDLTQIVEETLPALRRVVETGKARFVGITGLPLKVFRQLVARAEVGGRCGRGFGAGAAKSGGNARPAGICRRKRVDFGRRGLGTASIFANRARFGRIVRSKKAQGAAPCGAGRSRRFS